MSTRRRCIILIIRVTPSCTLVVVWIIRGPRQSIGGVFISKKSSGGLPYGMADLALPYSRVPCGSPQKTFRNSQDSLLGITGIPLAIPSPSAPPEERSLLIACDTIVVSYAIPTIHVSHLTCNFFWDYCGVNTHLGKTRNILFVFAQ